MKPKWEYRFLDLAINLKGALLPWIAILCFFGISMTVSSQISSELLLNRSIQYHDPQGNWSSFNDSLIISTESETGVIEEIQIHMNHIEGSFRFKKESNIGLFEGFILVDSSEYLLNNKTLKSSKVLQQLIKENETVDFLRDYYVYLWGLPMKLKDKEAVKSQKSLPDTLNDVSVYRMRVTYPNQVGPNVWYFYYKKSNYALNAIQFFYNEDLMDGETIILTGEKNIGSIRFSKQRKWLKNRNRELISREVLW